VRTISSGDNDTRGRALASRSMCPVPPVHLLHPGVGIVIISQWLGHASVTTTNRTNKMTINIGYSIVYNFPQATPMIVTLNVHYSRASDMVAPDHMVTEPAVPISGYRDGFGNWCSRIVAPPGRFRLAASGSLRDSGTADAVVRSAVQHDVQTLPEETLVFLLGSRYCETDLLSETAWKLFGNIPAGWDRVQAICDFVHSLITFSYEKARSTRTAWEAFNERTGVCRDFAHLAITFCRCLNIPARYCTGYLSDIGLQPPFVIMDFAAWFEAYLGGVWYTFDPRNNVPRIGRVLIARGRDAADVAITTTFGPNVLESFEVFTQEV
jgi:transglutaminase-like putative cysteine protease